MKTREDFVSNSSSASFVLSDEHARTGLALLKRLVEKYDVPWRVEDQLSLTLHASNKNIRALAEALGKETDVFGRYDADGWLAKRSREDPGDVESWYDVPFRMSRYDFDLLTEKALELVDRVEFRSDDGGGERFMLKLMYLFFDRNGCRPDAIDSEQDFIQMDDTEKFMCALAGMDDGWREDGKKTPPDPSRPNRREDERGISEEAPER